MRAELIMQQIETEMLLNLARLLKAGGSKEINMRWQYDKLQQLGFLQDQNVKVINKHRKELRAAIAKELEEQALKKARLVDTANKEAGKKIGEVLAVNADPAIKKILDMWTDATLKKFDGMIAPMLEKSQAIYADTIYKVVAKTRLGVSSADALAQACTEWSAAGLKALKDDAGRTWTTEAYAQMVIRTNTTQASFETQSQRMDELDNDLVEISSHLGARPKCEPYQGKVFSLHGKTKGYPLLSDTSYGEPDGLFGVNCRHDMYPYFPGTEKTYKPQDTERNETAYKNSQRQRYLERQLRAAKREQQVIERVGTDKDKEKAARLVKARSDAIKQFTEDTGRARRYTREKVY